jgi:hypothetical protein
MGSNQKVFKRKESGGITEQKGEVLRHSSGSKNGYDSSSYRPLKETDDN